MGLDMYINAVIYFSEFGKEKPLLDGIRSVCAEPLKGFTVNGVRVTLGYWRKANAIHNWFVNKVQNGVDECQNTDLTYEHLLALKTDCETVLADHSKANALLPPQSGFFFGGTDVDKYYFDDLKQTIKIINTIFTNPIICGEYQGKPYLVDGVVYHSSW
jgi:hypothetical protein